MAKSADKTSLEGPETGATAGLSGAHIFQAGPETMLLDPGAGDLKAFGVGSAADLISLSLGDLLPDAAGEVVLLAGNDMAINLLADVALTEAGIAAEHVTADGTDVTGLHYYSFESGLTVYSPADLLILTDPSLG